MSSYVYNYMSVDPLVYILMQFHGKSTMVYINAYVYIYIHLYSGMYIYIYITRYLHVIDKTPCDPRARTCAETC